MVPEAPLRETGAGLAPDGAGWFVVNGRDARWFTREGRGHVLPLTGWDEPEAESWFPQVGVNVYVLGPGEPMSMYHWEADQEDYLVVAGEALLIVEGQERPLRQWDFVHTPAEASHTIVGAGDGPCVVVAIGAREHQAGDDWGGYPVDEAALRHDVGVEQQTNKGQVAYARYPRARPSRYPEALLPDL